MARKLFSLENEDLTLSFDNVKEEVADSYEEINDALDMNADVRADLDVIDTTLDAIDNVTDNVNIVETTLNSGNEVSETSYLLVQESIKGFYRTVNYKPNKSKSTLESLQFESLNTNDKTKLTLEGFKETFNKIVDTIKKFFANLKEKLSNFWLKLTDNRKKLLERGKKFYEVYIKNMHDSNKYIPTNEITVKIPTGMISEPINFFRLLQDDIVSIETILKNINKQIKITKESYDLFKTNKIVSNKDKVLEEIKKLKDISDDYTKDFNYNKLKEQDLVEHTIKAEPVFASFMHGVYSGFGNVYLAYDVFSEHGMTLEELTKAIEDELNKALKTLEEELKQEESKETKQAEEADKQDQSEEPQTKEEINTDLVSVKDRLNVWFKMQQAMSKAKTTGLTDALRIAGFAYSNIAKLASVKFN